MSEVYGIIYVGTNNINGKQYVGQTTSSDPVEYCSSHIKEALKGKGGNKIFYKAIRKYGADAFNFEIIYIAFDKEELDAAEDYFIIYELKTLSPAGYNLRGGGARGRYSEEAKAYHSAICYLPEVNARKRAAAQKMWLDQEMRDKHSISLKIARNKPEAKEQTSITSKASWVSRKQDPVYIAEREAAASARAKRKEEEKLKRRLARVKKRWINDGINNCKLNIDEPLPDGWVYGRANFVIINTPESTERRSRAAKLACEDPLVIEHKREAMRLVHERPGFTEGIIAKAVATATSPEGRDRRAATEADPVIKNARRQAAFAQFSDPATIEAVRQRTLNQFADLAKRENHRAAYEKPDTKLKLSAIAKGTVWINNGVENRRMDADLPLPEGWLLGSIGMHIRWHVRRNIVNPVCPLCAPAVAG